MKYVGKLFGQIGRTRGYFDTGKTSGDWDALEARAERAEAEVEELKESILVQRIFSDYRQRAESAEAELAAERARLDWLESNAGDIHRYNSSKYLWFAHQNIRAAIDAAMKEGAK
jgi:hypothetical protein